MNFASNRSETIWVMPRAPDLCSLAVALLLVSCSRVPAQADSTLVAFNNDSLGGVVDLQDIEVLRIDATTESLVVRSGTLDDWPGIAVSTPGLQHRYWDLSAFTHVVTQVENLDSEALTVHMRVDNPPGTGARLRPWLSAKTVVPAGQSAQLRVPLRRSGGVELSGMQAYPQGMDPAGIGRTASVAGNGIRTQGVAAAYVQGWSCSRRRTIHGASVGKRCG